MADKIIYLKKEKKERKKEKITGEVVVWYNIHVQKSIKFKNKDRTADNITRNINSESAANTPAMLAVKFANTERRVCLGRGPHVFLKYRSHLKILGT
jgi:hypothetical protein